MLFQRDVSSYVKRDLARKSIKGIAFSTSSSSLRLNGTFLFSEYFE